MYFDGRNFNDLEIARGEYDDGMPVINAPLPGIFNLDGTPVTIKYTGARYFSYDHDMAKMVVKNTLGELNGDASQTVYDFLFEALGDCVAKGSTEFMLIFSSHGGG